MWMPNEALNPEPKLNHENHHHGTRALNPASDSEEGHAHKTKDTALGSLDLDSAGHRAVERDVASATSLPRVRGRFGVPRRCSGSHLEAPRQHGGADETG